MSPPRAGAPARPERRFKTFMWMTRRSWSRRRRVVAKAEWTKGKPTLASWSPRSTRDECKAKYLYEKVYCARGDMENRIKECQLDLYADRTSTATMRANQLRLWFYSMAYVLLCALRRIGLHDTEFAKATCGTIRLKLLKIGALVRISVRRIKIAMASGCPAAQVWGLAAIRLALAANARASPGMTRATAARNKRGIIPKPTETTLRCRCSPESSSSSRVSRRHSVARLQKSQQATSQDRSIIENSVR